MKRTALIIGLAVFVIETISEFILISTIPGHFKTWYALPDRHFVLAMRLFMNAVTALAAGMLMDFALRKSEVIRKAKEQQKNQDAFLNHHVRNALSALQYAAYLTRDQQVVEQCDASIARIVWALSNAKKVKEIGDDGYVQWLEEWKSNLGPSHSPSVDAESR